MTSNLYPLPNINAPALYREYNEFLAYLANFSPKKEKLKGTRHTVCFKLDNYFGDENIANKEFLHEYRSIPYMFLDRELLSELFNKIREHSTNEISQDSKDITNLARKAKSILDKQDIPSNDRWSILPISLNHGNNKVAITDLGFKIFEMPKGILDSQKPQTSQAFFGYKMAIELIVEIKDKMLIGKEYSHNLGIKVSYQLQIPKPESIISSYIKLPEDIDLPS